ncbi:plasmid transfer protein [Raoultella ornithinolytica]|uniref:Uncharacterized protein n=1 Tax=Klebsiella grimontii TaxID=2058152 RepID=A0A285AV09_9ENTR|nr:plasmid transfer protein [Klebsiella grimontii]SNU32529.1 conserved hypothetical protein [Klebsiella grimontii]
MVENLTTKSICQSQYRNEKVFNSGKSALELNTSASNGDVNLILTGSSPEKSGSFDWTGNKCISTKLSDDEVITLCMVFLRLTPEASLKDKKTKHQGILVYKNIKVTFDGKPTATLEGGVLAINKAESGVNFVHKISIEPSACLRLGLFLLSVIQSRNPGLPPDTILTCMRLNASARSQK